MNSKITQFTAPVLALSLGCLTLQAGLVVRYSYDDATVADPYTNTIIADDSLNGNTATLNRQDDPSATPGFNSNTFNSIGQSLDLTNNTAGNTGGGFADSEPSGFTGLAGNARTFSAWINTSEAADQVIAHWGVNKTDANTGERYTIRLDETTSGTFALRLEVAGGGIVGTAKLNTGNWVHVAVRQNGSTLGDVDFFVNGTADPLTSTSTTAIQTDISETAYGMLIGAEATNSQATNINSPFDGFIDEVRLYDEALSDTAIANLAIVPEPATYALFIGFVALGGILLRRRRR